MAWDGRRREGRGRERGFCATSGHARWIHRIRNGQITVDGQVVTDPDMILRSTALCQDKACQSSTCILFCRRCCKCREEKDVVTQPIGLVHYPGVAEGLYVACSSGKPAMSKVCVLERLAHQNQTLVQVEIHSGRPHQIRIHLAYIGHPLVEVMRGLYSLFPETVGITCMLIGWSFLIQPRIRFTDQQTIMTEHQMLKITAPLPHILQTREERCDPQVDT
ncbi:RNA pseudourine synthase 5 [Triticum urartu]|uniref:RNA pseudourine synthase 5 n=1 Tax=Triticum urartu TaxID=4572 RepID=M7Z3F5_TRIUA|nr:RNA pseudourine synthase 5 [Triticum urartu]